MSNHPQRNWRKRAAEAAEAWHADHWPEPDRVRSLDAGEFREIAQNIFIAGFDAGRKPRKPDEKD